MQVRDRDDVKWSVRRVWWPFGKWVLELPDWGGLFVIGMVLTAPLVLIWPFWLLAHAFGMPWTLVVRRERKEVRREKVTGWTASKERMAAILEEVREQGGPAIPPGVTVH